MNRTEQAETPNEVLSSPALLFLYHRLEQIMGIKASGDALVKLNKYIEESCGASFIEKPMLYENMLTSREQIFDIAKILTVNETYFFREEAHFELLIKFLSELTKENCLLRICSAATSIGCEAYSLAMLLDYKIKNGMNFEFEIDAFDVSAEAIETAKNARYTANTLRKDGSGFKHILDSYLVHDGDEYTVAGNIRKRVHFFTHNIMRGIDRQYDIIFFRNAIIYFTQRNRLIVMDNLADSLSTKGLLFLGISETSFVKHPLLANRYSADVFYFQKTAGLSDPPEWIRTTQLATHPPALPDRKQNSTEEKEPVKKQTDRVKNKELQVDSTEITLLLGKEDGQPNAKKTIDILENLSSPEIANSLSGSELAASTAYFLNVQDFNSADLVLSYLEKFNSGALTRFLRGEYHFSRGSSKEAERYFEDAAGKDKAFWPAFYRIASLAANGNHDRYCYKIKKAIASIELNSKSQGEFECFMGGFSSDYFRRLLEKKLA